MPCNTCKLQFNLFKRKHSCLSCHHFYCTNCFGKRKKSLCIRCEIIHYSSKNDLMLLKTKDLVFFLQSRKVNISGIVEKEELCNLIINHINSSSYCESIQVNSSPSTSSDFDNYSQNFDQIKKTCQNFFTSVTEKIASDLQKTTCFNQSSNQHNKRENPTTEQPKLKTPTYNFHNLGVPSTSGTANLYTSDIDTFQTNNHINDCECCSDEELTEISEKRQKIFDANLADVQFFRNNSNNTKLDETSSNSSFEELPMPVVSKKSDDDWQFIEKKCIINKNPRRKSDSSLLNLKKLSDTSEEISNIQISCKKCGKSKTRLTEELLKLNEQLHSSNRSENEISTKIKQFMHYLDNKKNEPMNGPQSSSPSTSHDQNIETIDNNSTPEKPQSKEDPSNAVLGSSKRFLTLDDIHSSEDLESLSVKQLKELLALNRVDFKGCCEKKELKERVQRLWKSYKSAPSSDKLTTVDLCKICMDAPIECVFLECGHTATCTACGKVLNECPICRSYIVRVVRIFKS